MFSIASFGRTLTIMNLIFLLHIEKNQKRKGSSLDPKLKSIKRSFRMVKGPVIIPLSLRLKNFFRVFSCVKHRNRLLIEFKTKSSICSMKRCVKKEACNQKRHLKIENPFPISDPRTGKNICNLK